MHNKLVIPTILIALSNPVHLTAKRKESHKKTAKTSEKKQEKNSTANKSSTSKALVSLTAATAILVSLKKSAENHTQEISVTLSPEEKQEAYTTDDPLVDNIHEPIENSASKCYHYITHITRQWQALLDDIKTIEQNHTLSKAFENFTKQHNQQRLHIEDYKQYIVIPNKKAFYASFERNNIGKLIAYHCNDPQITLQQIGGIIIHLEADKTLSSSQNSYTGLIKSCKPIMDQFKMQGLPLQLSQHSWQTLAESPAILSTMEEGIKKVQALKQKEISTKNYPDEKFLKYLDSKNIILRNTKKMENIHKSLIKTLKLYRNIPDTNDINYYKDIPILDLVQQQKTFNKLRKEAEEQHRIIAKLKI